MTDEPSISSSDVSVNVSGFNPATDETRSATRTETKLVYEALVELDDPEADALAQELREAVHPDQHSLAWEAERKFNLGVLR